MKLFLWLKKKWHGAEGLPTQLGRMPEGRELWRLYLEGRLSDAGDDSVHLKATMNWLSRSISAWKGRGSAACYSLESGWADAYPETSGYIIGTLLAYYDQTGDRRYFQEAVSLGDWELDIQAASGAVLSGVRGDVVRVFNTGQVILGWCLLYERTGNARYLESALKAAVFLLGTQEPDGTWVRNTYCGARTYHSRVDWALLKVADISGEKRFEDAAIRNLLWVKSCVRGNGWIANCGFNQEAPITHVIDYTLRGLLECHLLRPELDLLKTVELSVGNLLPALGRNTVRGIRGMLSQSYDASWAGDAASSCLTGNAQLAYLFYRLAQVGSSLCLIDIADEIVHALKRTQILDCQNEGIEGGLPGCYPMGSGYCRWSFPNWGAKFFADALMMKHGYRGAMSVGA